MTIQKHLSLLPILILLCCTAALAQRPGSNPAKDREEWLKTLPEKVRDSIVFIEWKQAVAAKEKEEEEASKAKLEEALANPQQTVLDLSYYPKAELDPRITSLKNIHEINLSRSKKLDLNKLFDLLSKLPNLQTLNLSGGNYSSMPGNISLLTGLQTLYLRDNNFRELPESFAKLQQLTTLHMQHNAYLADESLYDRLRTMKVSDLDLSACGYYEVNEKLGQVTTLHRLSLATNDIKILPASIKQLTNLQALDLSGNGNLNLQAICLSLAPLSTLAELRLDECYLTVLPAELGSLKSLHILSLNENVLTALPGSLSGLTSLQELYISSSPNAFRVSKIQSLPAGLGALKQLRILDLSGNQLTAISSDMDQWTQLEVLNLSRNQLTTLPASIGALTQLHYLNLSLNKISDIPAAIGQLVNLDSLKIDGDFFAKPDKKIHQLPADICNLKNLKRLTLKDNVIEQLPAQIGRLEQLTSLDLRGNVLTALPASFTQLTRLQALDLKSNDLQGLPEGFARLSALTDLNIAMNTKADYSKIIPVLATMHGLKLLDISYNNLTRADAQPLIDHLPACRIINLDYSTRIKR